MGLTRNLLLFAIIAITTSACGGGGGTSATDTPNFININDSTATQYTITLPSGTYDFRIAAVDTNGYAGLLSPAISETL
ncbi:MAG: hypothetical protein P8047_13495 [Gammaproteobacteria bacterium]